MATFEELENAFRDPTLRKKARTAAIIRATEVLAETGNPNEVNRRLWARTVLRGPDKEAEIILKYVVADNSNAPIANILGTSDVNAKAAVTDAIIDHLANGLAAELAP